MLNFKILVESLLLEGVNDTKVDSVLGTNQTPENKWVYDIVEKHTKLFPNIPVDQNRLQNCFSQALGTYNAKPKRDTLRDCIPLERLYDAFYIVANSARGKVNFTTPNEFATQATTYGNDFYQKNIQNIQTPANWQIINSDVRRAYEKLMDDVDLTSKAALQTYNTKSIYDTVNEIIKKRSDAHSRIMAIRTPFGSGFEKLLMDTLLNPEQYAAGNKKVTNDFKNIVDDLYFKNLITIGLRAKDFYESVSTVPKTDPQFKSGYEKMLKNIDPKLKFTIQDIEKIKSEESLDLINALRSIAEYQKSKVGRGEQFKKAGQAMSSLAAFGGHSLYGGPS